MAEGLYIYSSLFLAQLYGRLKPILYYRHWFYISNNGIHSCVQYDSGDEVDHTNVESFIEKEVQKIRDKGLSCYYKGGKFKCPYCTKPKPRDGLYEHLLDHARASSVSGDDPKIRAQHAALVKALYPV
jgi:hypothetical protein